MTYSTELNKYSRTRIAYCKIITGYCDEVFGTAPCTASGSVKCYNTFPTCQDTVNFNKTTKEYEFISADLPHSTIKDYFPAKPYIITDNVSSLPTEIKATDTVIKRLKIQFKDEPDNDVGVDPYRADRTAITGTFWKKFAARNKNYKGNIIEYYEGFPGLALANFEMKFAGRIENITIKEGSAIVESTDMLKKLSEINYPLKTDVYLDSRIPMVFEAASQGAMLALNALSLDYCKRSDYYNIPSITLTPYASGGGMSAGLYNVTVIAYDSDDRPIAKGVDTQTLATDEGMDVSWGAVTGADYYYLFFKLTGGDFEKSEELAVSSYDINDGVTTTTEDPPDYAERIFYFTGDDPSDIGDWTQVYTELTIVLSEAISSETTGYIKIDKEVLYFGSKSLGVYGGIKRAQAGTDAAWHEANTKVELLLQESPDDGFTHLKSLLTLGGIDSAYVDAKFTTYETTGSDIEHSTNVIFKKTKLNKIYFDLVNALDCMSWVGEDGKIKILKNTEIPSTIPALTDEANIIKGSDSVDLNEDSRRTRWLQYWNRWDVEKGLEDKEAYNRLTMAIDTVAESSDEYDDEIEDVQYTTWINTDSDTSSNIADYLTALLVSRKGRTRDALPYYICSVELKDNDILTGDVVLISTDMLQDQHGSDYAGVAFRLIKKTPQGNKVQMKFIRVISPEGVLLLESGDSLLLETGFEIITKIF